MFGYHVAMDDEMRVAFNGATFIVRKEVGFTNVAYKEGLRAWKDAVLPTGQIPPSVLGTRVNN